MENGETRVRRSLLGIVTATGAAFAGAAFAQEAVGVAEDWQWGFQGPNSSIMRDVFAFYDWVLLPMMLVISAFVLTLMAYILARFRRSANPEPSRNTHNTVLEAIWTAVPILVLIGIAIPSLRLLYEQETTPEADMTLKAIGHQWYWSYEYPDSGIAFDSLMVDDADLREGQLRLLTTDTEVVLPVGRTIRVQVTSDDVIHAWALPAAGVKMDAVPGRLNEFWMELDTPGVYYGQCSELCGQLHGFMPIMVVALEGAEFDAWVAERRAALGVANEVELASARNRTGG